VAEDEDDLIMSRGPSNVRATDVAKLLLAIKRSGNQPASIEIEGGRVRIKLKDGSDAEDIVTDETDDTAAWDEKYGQH
jgi:hypothetical protein